MLLLTILGYIADVNIQVVKTTTTTNKILKKIKKNTAKVCHQMKKKKKRNKLGRPCSFKHYITNEESCFYI